MKHMFDKEKHIYDQTPIPEELPDVIQHALKTAAKPVKAHRYIWLKSVSLAAVACCAAFVVSVNTSTVFAQSVYDIPILGSFAKIVTFREYQSEDQFKMVNVKIPALENTGHTELEKKINTEILNKMNSLVEESKIRAKEYYDAFVETGGKKEDFLPVDIIVDYEVKHSDDSIVSFVVTRFEGAFSAYTEKFYYNVDIKSGKQLTLKDMLGNNFKETANQVIRQQIDAASAEEGSMFFQPEDGTDADFKTIRDDQNFYINSDGKVVIVFDKYEIAAGAAGFPEFVIN